MRRVAAAVFVALLLPVSAQAQPATLHGQCDLATGADVREFCHNVAAAAQMVQPRVGIGLSGGNPVPGTASTMGMRLGTLPRVSLGVRVTGVAAELPPIERHGDTRSAAFPLFGISADVGVGLYQGMALLPTVGGFGSLDLLASIGVLSLPRGRGFADRAAGSWAAGARFGVLRESFTAPGISVDALYRSFGDVTYGSEDLSGRDAYFELSDNSALSLRATVGKRMFGFGLTAGVASDRYRSAARVRVLEARSAESTHVLELGQQRLATTRTSLFGNASLTLLILNLAGEVGWQTGSAARAGAPAASEKGGLFGGVAARLAI